eukprot:COSAG04_NODE_51_length_31064_cov_38.384789_7_plen_47_part_00
MRLISRSLAPSSAAKRRSCTPRDDHFEGLGAVTLCDTELFSGVYAL